MKDVQYLYFTPAYLAFNTDGRFNIYTYVCPYNPCMYISVYVSNRM